MEPIAMALSFIGSADVSIDLKHFFIIMLAAAITAAFVAWQHCRQPLFWFLYGLVAGPIALAHLTIKTTYGFRPPPSVVDE